MHKSKHIFIIIAIADSYLACFIISFILSNRVVPCDYFINYRKLKKQLVKAVPSPNHVLVYHVSWRMFFRIQLCSIKSIAIAVRKSSC